MPNNKRKRQMYNLNDLEPEVLQEFYRKTINAILIISATYAVGFASFLILFLLKTGYSFFAILIPLFGYFWLITLGSKFVNNYYGFKRTPDGNFIYVKEGRNYGTFTVIYVIILLVSSIVRIIYELNNLSIIIEEIESHTEE